MATNDTQENFTRLRRDLAAGNILPVYLLHGEEGYFIDELVKEFESLVPEDERDFNLYTLYAPESGVETAMDICHRYPMMSDRQVVILKECQAIRSDSLNKLHHYASRPNASTVFVICSRGAAVKGKELLAAVKKNGLIFTSNKFKENQIGPAITALAKEKGLNIEPKAMAMLRDYIGTDLSRLYNEIDKLALILGKGAMITPEAIERNVGISKDFNNFELVDALTKRNPRRAFEIVKYFANNPKNNPVTVTLSTLFNLFSNILIYHYTADKSPSGYMNALEFRNEWQLKYFEPAPRAYNVRQTIEIISAIRRCDTRSKGIGARQDEYDLLNDLIFHILTVRGVIEV
ncbi:MAG: DNA polymerase III subunit delta [Muribaculaceae bacterium]|nr:DNA polymerase III subunit delta [Muribaculaceae bacterium]